MDSSGLSLLKTQARNRGRSWKPLLLIYVEKGLETVAWFLYVNLFVSIWRLRICLFICLLVTLPSWNNNIDSICCQFHWSYIVFNSLLAQQTGNTLERCLLILRFMPLSVSLIALPIAVNKQLKTSISSIFLPFGMTIACHAR